MNRKIKAFVAGHNGMVGSSIVRKLKKKSHIKIITINKKNLNLLDQQKVFQFLKKKKPDQVFIAAAKVGGILANSKQKYDFLYENLQIQNNLIHGSFRAGVKNLLFLGSSCAYPKNSKQPIKEKYLLSGELENTNDAYAIAKIAGLKMCHYIKQKYKLNYKTLMPNNLFGPGDNYDLQESHFFSALIKKVIFAMIYKKKYIEIWGTGRPLRELMYVDDLADACIFFINKRTSESIINIGSGIEFSIKSYLKKIMKFFNVNYKIKFLKKKPDGMFRKKLDTRTLKKYGWKPKFSLDEGMSITIKEYLKKHNIKLRSF